MKIINLLSSFILCVLAPLTYAHAEDAYINALSLQTLHQKKSIQIQPFDDSNDNLVLQKISETQLCKSRHTIDPSESLILTFSTRDQIGNWDSGSKREIFSLKTKTGRGFQERTKAQVNVFTSATGGLLNKGNDTRKAVAIASQYKRDMTLTNSENSQTYWRAWSIADLGAGGGISLSKQLIPPLIQSIGRTIRHKAFTAKY
jgi:hypothetical protein